MIVSYFQNVSLLQLASVEVWMSGPIAQALVAVRVQEQAPLREQAVRIAPQVQEVRALALVLARGLPPVPEQGLQQEPPRALRPRFAEYRLVVTDAPCCLHES